MKKSRKQRKLETAKRLAAEEAIRKATKKTVIKTEERKSEESKTENPFVDKLRDYQITSETNIFPERYILKAALQERANPKNVLVYDIPSYHSDIYTYHNIRPENRLNYIEGFVDNFGTFLNRSDAGEVAYAAKQCSEYSRNSLTSNGYKHLFHKVQVNTTV